MKRIATRIITIALFTGFGVAVAATGPDPTLDPFVRVTPDGEAVFGVLFAETERVTRGLYRVDFARDLSRCATALTLRYDIWRSRSEVHGSTLSAPTDAQAVYVVVTSQGRLRDSGFDLLLRCAPGLPEPGGATEDGKAAR